MRVPFLTLLLILQLPTLHSMDSIDMSRLLDSAEMYRQIDLAKAHKFVDAVLNMSDESEVSYCQALRSKAITYYYQGKMDSVLSCNEMMGVSACYRLDTESRFKYHTLKAKILNQRGMIDSALWLYDQALDIAESSGNLNYELEVYGGKGVVYYENGDFPQAIKYYLKAEDLFDQVTDLNPIQQTNIIHNIGASFDIIGDYEKAGMYLQQALELSEDRPQQRVHSLLSIGSLYTNMDSFNQAKSFLLRSIEENDFNPYLKAFSHLSLAELLLTDIPDEALPYAEQAYATFQEVEDHFHASKSKAIMARVGMNLGRLTNVNECVKQAKLHAEKSKNSEQINKVKLLEIEFLLHQQVGSESAQELRQYQYVSDSLSQLLLDKEIKKLENETEMRMAVDSIQYLSQSVADHKSIININRGIIALLCLLGPVLFYLGYLAKRRLTVGVESIDNEVLILPDEILTPIDAKASLDQKFTIDGDETIHTTYADITSIQAKNGGIQVNTFDGTSSFIWTSLAKYIKLLPNEHFIRVSKFHIISLVQIDSIVKLELKLKNGKIVKLSPAYKKRFFEAYQSYSR